MANVLDPEKRLRVLAALVEGNSERAVERMTGVNRETVGRLSLMFGEGAIRLHNRIARDLACSLVQVDEIFSYVQKKQARVTIDDSPEVGEAYTFVALDASSRFVIGWYVGKRDQASTDIFMQDIRARLVAMPAMTSDGFAPYISAIGASFGPSIDYAQTVKNYTKRGRREGGPDHRYEPPRDPFITKKSVYGAPNLDKASTAYVERNNATMRHHIGRMRRLCLAFSKKLANHRAAVALNYAWYNLGTIVKTLRVTPAMAAGVTDHVWSLDEFMGALLDETPCEARLRSRSYALGRRKGRRASFRKDAGSSTWSMAARASRTSPRGLLRRQPRPRRGSGRGRFRATRYRRWGRSWNCSRGVRSGLMVCCWIHSRMSRIARSHV